MHRAYIYTHIHATVLIHVLIVIVNLRIFISATGNQSTELHHALECYIKENGLSKDST